MDAALLQQPAQPQKITPIGGAVRQTEGPGVITAELSQQDSTALSRSSRVPAPSVCPQSPAAGGSACLRLAPVELLLVQFPPLLCDAELGGPFGPSSHVPCLTGCQARKHRSRERLARVCWPAARAARLSLRNWASVHRPRVLLLCSGSASTSWSSRWQARACCSRACGSAGGAAGRPLSRSATASPAMGIGNQGEARRGT